MDIVEGYYPDITRYRDSFNLWCRPPPGRREWAILFQDGFIDPSFIRMFYVDRRGVRVNVTVRGQDVIPYSIFDTAPPPDVGVLGAQYTYDVGPTPTNRVLTGALPDCLYVVIYRETPTHTPLVQYKFNGSRLPYKDVDDATRQILHALVEADEAVNIRHAEYVCDCPL